MLFILLVCACTVHAQTNYVLNPSFEQYNQCPEGYNQVKFARYWNGIDTTWSPGDSLSYIPYCLPEYCNECSNDTHCCTVPFSTNYYQYPRSGNGMIEEVMYYDAIVPFPNNRDYLQGRLSSSLILGKSYCITFYLNFEGNMSSCFAVGPIGAYLDNGSIDTAVNTCGNPQTQYYPQVFTDSIVADTVNWVMVQGNFIATGTEAFITIGNFSDNAHTHIAALPGPCESDYSVYLIDDVSVIESDAVANAGPDAFVSPGSDSVWIGSHEEGLPCKWYIAGNPTAISVYGGFKVHPDTTTRYVMELDLCSNVTYDTVVVYAAPAGVTSPRPSPKEREVFPNPARDIVSVTNSKGCEMVIYDVYGSARFTMTSQSDKEQVDISNLPNGVYFIGITDPFTKERTTRKIVKE